MSQLKKRERASNFDKSETLLLTELVVKHRSIIENKKTDAATNKEKEAAWSTIATDFNAASNGPAVRTAKTLKLKYESVKKTTKKKMLLHKQGLYRTGGRPVALAFGEVEEKMLAVLEDTSGIEARTDSENIADITDARIPATDPSNEEGIPNIRTEGTLETADTAESITPAESKKAQTRQIEEVIEQTDEHRSPWNQKALETTISPGLKPLTKPKTTKAEVAAKLDRLSKARLELVELQKEIARKEHGFVVEEHELKMTHLQDEDRRKQELHEILVSQLTNK